MAESRALQPLDETACKLAKIAFREVCDLMLNRTHLLGRRPFQSGAAIFVQALALPTCLTKQAESWQRLM